MTGDSTAVTNNRPCARREPGCLYFDLGVESNTDLLHDFSCFPFPYSIIYYESFLFRQESITYPEAPGLSNLASLRFTQARLDFYTSLGIVSLSTLPT